jgi:DNA-directed RNA polymerase specialized sigma24 family protein
MMTMDDVIAALREPADWDTEADLGQAMRHIPPKYAVLLIQHYRQGWSQRQAMRAARSKSWQDWQRARLALMRELNDGA